MPELKMGGRRQPEGYGHITTCDQFHHSEESNEWQVKAILMGAVAYVGSCGTTTVWCCELLIGEDRYLFRAPSCNAACRNLVEHIINERT